MKNQKENFNLLPRRRPLAVPLLLLFLGAMGILLVGVIVMSIKWATAISQQTRVLWGISAGIGFINSGFPGHIWDKAGVPVNSRGIRTHQKREINQRIIHS